MLDVNAGAEEMEVEEEEGDGVEAVAVGGVLSEGETVGLILIGEDDAGATAGAAVIDVLGVPVVYVTFFTTP